MKSIIFIGTNKSGSSLEGIKAAKRLGFIVHVLTERSSLLEQKDDFPAIDEIYLVDLKDVENVKEVILQIHSSHRIACIVSFIDSFVHLAANFSNELCDTRLSTNAMFRMENKLVTRENLRDNDYSPFYFTIKRNESIYDYLELVEGKFPLIVKLPQSCGSKDVVLVNSERELSNRLRFLRKKEPESDILIEEYLNGPQLIVEAIAHNGTIEIAAVIEQEITSNERFIVTGYCISPEIAESVHNELLDTAKEIINRLGLENGNCHLELRHTNGKWKLIEANPRISGGIMNSLIKEAYGFNYAEQIIKVYLGMEPSIPKNREETVYAHYMTVDSIGELITVTGNNKALKVPGVVDVFIKAKKGQILTPPLSMANRYGYVLAKGKTKEEAKQIAIEAARFIEFHLQPH